MEKSPEPITAVERYVDGSVGPVLMLLFSFFLYDLCNSLTTNYAFPGHMVSGLSTGACRRSQIVLYSKTIRSGTGDSYITLLLPSVRVTEDSTRGILATAE